MWICWIVLLTASLAMSQYDGPPMETDEGCYEEAEKTQPSPPPPSSNGGSQLAYTIEVQGKEISPEELITLVQGLLGKLRSKLERTPQAYSKLSDFDAAVSSSPPPGVQSDFVDTISNFVSTFTKIADIFTGISGAFNVFSDAPGGDQFGGPDDDITSMINDITAGIAYQMRDAAGPPGTQSDFFSSAQKFMGLGGTFISLLQRLLGVFNKYNLLSDAPRPFNAPPRAPAPKPPGRPSPGKPPQNQNDNRRPTTKKPPTNEAPIIINVYVTANQNSGQNVAVGQPKPTTTASEPIPAAPVAANDQPMGVYRPRGYGTGAVESTGYRRRT
ncbi:hypothetical protein Q1695_007703 [Nippostrongylus brasiliensis]|nr:hypothetical protein Q1695_007703 [Nippostrongylus brasiliensis]